MSWLLRAMKDKNFAGGGRIMPGGPNYKWSGPQPGQPQQPQQPPPSNGFGGLIDARNKNPWLTRPRTVGMNQRPGLGNLVGSGGGNIRGAIELMLKNNGGPRSWMMQSPVNRPVPQRPGVIMQAYPGIIQQPGGFNWSTGQEKLRDPRMMQPNPGFSNPTGRVPLTGPQAAQSSMQAVRKARQQAGGPGQYRGF